MVRNSDGLKVKVTKVARTMNVDVLPSSYMPKGGVTVTPVITSKAISDIWARIS